LTLLPTDIKTTSSGLWHCSIAGGNESDDDEVEQPSKLHFSECVLMLIFSIVPKTFQG
jgi:hypothetical protein